MREKTVGSKNVKIKTCVAPSYPHSSSRIFEPMTRTQTRTYGVLNPSTRQPLLEAMLRAFCWLVSNVASLFGLTITRHTRDWHTDEAEDDHLPTPNDPTQKEVQFSQRSFSGKRKARIPGIPVATTQGTTPYSRATQNQDARDKPEHDSPSIEAARTKSPPSNGGGAARAPISTMAFRWGTDLSTRTVRTRRTTVPLLTCSCGAHLACSSSPVRGRKTPALAPS